MYAIIATGGKQYKVSEGDIIRVEKLDAEVDILSFLDGFVNIWTGIFQSRMFFVPGVFSKIFRCCYI